ncbi:MAG: hypothetical protein WCS28_12110 [Thiomicrospira sp.]
MTKRDKQLITLLVLVERKLNRLKSAIKRLEPAMHQSYDEKVLLKLYLLKQVTHEQAIVGDDFLMQCFDELKGHPLLSCLSRPPFL